MSRARPPLPILLLTVTGFCTLYAPQPLLPELAQAFGVEAADASLLITLTMLPLAAAPLVYGYVLQAVAARLMLITASLVLALCQSAMALVDTWTLLLALRVVVGLTLPALFAALMTYVAESAEPARRRQALAWYVAATIVGGFTGRALSGLAASAWDWHIALGLWGPVLLAMALWTRRLSSSRRSGFGRMTPRVFIKVFEQPGLAQAYLAILCIFFVFAAVLNLLPFRMAELHPEAGSAGIGLAYLGYLSGLVISLNAARLGRRFGSEVRLYLFGLALYALGLALFSLQSFGGIYLAMFAFCGGMFLVHTRLAGHVNQSARAGSTSVVNGIYIAAYYLGGALGSWLPAGLYRYGGWTLFLGALAVVLILAAVSLRSMLRHGADPRPVHDSG